MVGQEPRRWQLKKTLFAYDLGRDLPGAHQGVTTLWREALEESVDNASWFPELVADQCHESGRFPALPG